MSAQHLSLPVVETASPGAAVQLHWPSEAATAAFATQLASAAALGNAFITLHGELGAGKTSLVRHLLQALGVSGRVKSPSYAIVEVYDLPQLTIWHFDFYRFNDPREWEDAGFRDLFSGAGLKLAEWPQKAGPLLPVPDLALHIDVQDDASRSVRLEAASATGLALLAHVRPHAA